MRSRSSGYFMLTLVVFLLLLGCASAPPSLGPKGQAAYYALRVVKVLDVVRDTAIAANDQTPPLISTEDTRHVVDWHTAALRTIQAVPDGWKPTVVAGLTQLETTLAAATRAHLAPYFTLLKAILAEVP